jgi:AcrR family transcriptional regulator
MARTGSADGGEIGERGERTRLRLLDQAIRRFGDRGFRETSLSAIARDAGVTPAAVYAYFPDKDGLFAAALDHDATTWLDEALADGGLGPARWLGLMQRLHARLADHPLAHRVLAGLEPEMLARVYQLPSSARLRVTLTDSLRLGQTLGRIRPDLDPPVIAEGIASVIEATLLATVQTGGFADAERRAGVLALLSAALLTPGSVPLQPPAP